jgi:hypothetical protein
LSARLLYAYADALLAAGRTNDAREAFAKAAVADTHGETDAAERLDELDGFEFEDLADDDEYLADDEDLAEDAEDAEDLADDPVAADAEAADHGQPDLGQSDPDEAEE